MTSSHWLLLSTSGIRQFRVIFTFQSIFLAVFCWSGLSFSWKRLPIEPKALTENKWRDSRSRSFVFSLSLSNIERALYWNPIQSQWQGLRLISESQVPTLTVCRYSSSFSGIYCEPQPSPSIYTLTENDVYPKSIQFQKAVLLTLSFISQFQLPTSTPSSLKFLHSTHISNNVTVKSQALL